MRLTTTAADPLITIQERSKSFSLRRLLFLAHTSLTTRAPDRRLRREELRLTRLPRGARVSKSTQQRLRGQIRSTRDSRPHQARDRGAGLRDREVEARRSSKRCGVQRSSLPGERRGRPACELRPG